MITLRVGSARIFFLGGTWAVSDFCAFDFWNRVGNWSQPLLWILVWQFEIRMRYAASAPEPSSPCLQTKSKTHVWALESAMLNDCVCVLCFFLSIYQSIYLSIYLYVYIYIYIYTCFFLMRSRFKIEAILLHLRSCPAEDLVSRQRPWKHPRGQRHDWDSCVPAWTAYRGLVMIKIAWTASWCIAT